MIAILEWTKSNIQQNIEQLHTPTMGVTKIGFEDQLSLNAGQKYIAECSKWSILQYSWPLLSYHLSLRPLFCLFLSGSLRQVLLYLLIYPDKQVPWKFLIRWLDFIYTACSVDLVYMGRKVS